MQANLGDVCGGARGERTSRGAGTQRGLFCQVGEQLGFWVGEQLGHRVGEQLGLSRQQLGLSVGKGTVGAHGRGTVGAHGREHLELMVGEQLGLRVGEQLGLRVGEQ